MFLAVCFSMTRSNVRSVGGSLGRMGMEYNVIVLLSGGIDSTACVNYYLSQKLKLLGLFIDYGQYVVKGEKDRIVNEKTN